MATEPSIAERPDAANRASSLSAESGGDAVLVEVAKLLGRKWHPVILRRLVTRGPFGFNELKTELGGVSSRVLSDALDDLEERRLVDREVVGERPTRVNYAVTERGRALEPVLASMERWGHEYLDADSL